MQDRALPHVPEDRDAEPYFPPTDPVITTNEQGDPEILGGFAGSATDDPGVVRSSSDGEPGDGALTDAVMRELKRDAATTDLEVRVEVRKRVAYVYGVVEDMVDAENAEEVAGRVPGINEVVDKTKVAGL